VGKHRRPDLDTAAYKAARLEFLAAHDVCHWCRRAKATQVDHKIEVDRGIDPTDQENWVPSCAKCNARRGAEHLARKKKNQADKRIGIQTPIFFENEKEMTPTPSVNSPHGESTGVDLDGFAWIGREEPRLRTIVPDGPSWGQDVVAWAAKFMRVQFLPWQVRLLDDMLKGDLEGEGMSLYHRAAYWSCARQNGKSEIGKAICGWWITEFSERRGKPQTILTTAHNMKVAGVVFRTMGDLLAEYFDAKVRQGNGREEIEVRNSAGVSRWFLMAGRENAARGFTADLVWVDEVQEFDSDVINRGFLPTMKTRNPFTAGGTPLLLLSGTAGTQASNYQINYREQAIQNIDTGTAARQYLAEWSPPPTIPWTDRRGWLWANPSLPILLTPDSLENSFKTSERASFIKEDLNTFVSAEKAWIMPEQWESCQTDQPMPPGGYLAVDSNIDEGRFVGIRAAQDATGLTQVGVAFIVKTEAEAWEQIAQVMADKSTRLLITPSLEIHAPIEYRPRLGIVGYAEIQKFTATVHSMISGRRLVHDGNQSLAEHVCRAVMVRTMGSVALTSTRSPGPIELCRAMVWAAAYASQPVAAKSRAAVAFAS